MTQTISKDGKVKCVSSVPYPDDVIKQMKKAGHRVKMTEGKNERNR